MGLACCLLLLCGRRLRRCEPAGTSHKQTLHDAISRTSMLGKPYAITYSALSLNVAAAIAGHQQPYTDILYVQVRVVEYICAQPGSGQPTHIGFSSRGLISCVAGGTGLQ
jgi:hypothetical protein